MLSRAVFLAVLISSLATTALAQSAPSEAWMARSFPAPPVRARAAVVMDATNGRMMLGYNAHLHLTMASTTKMMTALVALQHGSLADQIVVPAAAFNYEADATVMGLRPGEVVSLQELLYGLLLPSGADAANTIAIHFGGSEAGFVAMMNHEAQVLGLHDTYYVDATGLSAADHTSAHDLAVLGQYISYLPDLIHVTSTRTHHWNGRTLTNVNQVLFWYPGVDGLKPGFTYAAGLCQVIDARRDGRHVVVAILNTPDLDIDARNLLNFGLHAFTWVKSKLPGDSPGYIQSGVTNRVPWQYFPASGHYLRGPFLHAFLMDGGLAALGYPRTEPLTEGQMRVQYFQNGVLELHPGTGTVTRMTIGLMPLPTPPVPTPPVAGPTPTATSGEGTIVPGGSATPGDSATPTPKPRVTPTPKPRVTSTPSPRHVLTARPFQGFQSAHRALLGSPTTAVRWVDSIGVQMFTYGALASDSHTHTVYLLPVGDRLLAARKFLPPYPGNVYPIGFAPPALLKTIGWLQGK